MIRILFVGHQKPYRDGIANHNTTYLKYLSRTPGIEISVLHNQDTLFRINGIKYIRFNPLTWARKANYFDLVHFQFGSNFRSDFADLCFLLMPSKRPYKVVSTIHDFSSFNVSKYYRILKEDPLAIGYSIVNLPLGRILGKSDTVIVYSRYFKKRLIKKYSGYDRIIRVVRHGAEVPLSLPQKKLWGGFRICSFGAISPRKGYREPIEAVIQLNQGGAQVKYDIYGEAPFGFYLGRLKRLVSESDCVHFPGFIPDRRILETLRRYDVILLPRKYTNEGGSGSLCHAISSQVPIVASRIGAFPEYIQHGKTGFLLPHSRQSYNQIIQELIEGKFDLSQIAQEIEYFLKSELAWPVVCEKHEAIYREIAPTHTRD